MRPARVNATPGQICQPQLEDQPHERQFKNRAGHARFLVISLYELQAVQSEKRVKNIRGRILGRSLPDRYTFSTPFFPVHRKLQMNIDRGGAQSLGRNLNVQWNEREQTTLDFIYITNVPIFL